MTNSSTSVSLHSSFSKSLFFNILSYAGVVLVAFLFYLYGKNKFVDGRKRKGIRWEIFKRFFKGDEKERAAREIRNC